MRPVHLLNAAKFISRVACNKVKKEFSPTTAFGLISMAASTAIVGHQVLDLDAKLAACGKTCPEPKLAQIRKEEKSLSETGGLGFLTFVLGGAIIPFSPSIDRALKLKPTSRYRNY